MAEEGRSSKKSSSHNRSKPTQPPGRSYGPKSMAETKVSKSKARSSRTHEASNSNGKSRPRESKKSKSRPKETPRESRPTDNKSKPRDEMNSSRSKSRTRESSKSQPQDKTRSSSNKRSKNSPKRKTSSTRSKSPPKQRNSVSKPKSHKNGSHKNGTRSSTKKQPSVKKRERFETAAQKAIPATVCMISGCRDAQTSADVSNISSQFQLPSAAGRSGGACTAALLQVLYQSHDNGIDDISWVDVLRQMRDVLDDKGFEQIPQLTSSRMIDVRDPFLITPTDGSFNRKNNTQRAVLIGINYTGQSGELSGCHNDVHNVAKYLAEVQGFRKENVTILMDDGAHKSPTKSAIMTTYKRLVRESKAGDVVFCHYSGHGGRLPDDNGDEDDGYDETLIPVDYDKKGQIRDDDLLKLLVHPMPEGVTMTCLMDCCHSGTVLDLPYQFTADGDLEEMEMNERTNFKDALWSGMGLAVGMAAGGAVASAVASAVTPQPEMMILGGGPNAIHEYSDTDCCVIS